VEKQRLDAKLKIKSKIEEKI
jgi:vacuolar-type H+-ATPase subunit F/Vma7